MVEFQQRGNPTFSARRSEEEEEEKRREEKGMNERISADGLATNTIS